MKKEWKVEGGRGEDLTVDQVMVACSARYAPVVPVTEMGCDVKYYDEQRGDNFILFGNQEGLVKSVTGEISGGTIEKLRGYGIIIKQVWGPEDA